MNLYHLYQVEDQILKQNLLSHAIFQEI
jgi:hypothetical protein